MKNIRIFLSENVHFLVVKFSVYFNRRVFVMSVPMCRTFSERRLKHFDRVICPVSASIPLSG